MSQKTIPSIVPDIAAVQTKSAASVPSPSPPSQVKSAPVKPVATVQPVTVAQPSPTKPAPAKPATVKPSPTAPPMAVPAQTTLANSPDKLPTASRFTQARKSLIGPVLFLLIVIVPTALMVFYYAFIATPQFESRTLFAVRGTEASPLAAFGLSALPGTSSSASDAYIITEYIRSLQLIKDLGNRGLDLRSYYALEKIDAVFRVDIDMPLEEFVHYWGWVSDVHYNSTTEIISFTVRAFSKEDASTISRGVLEAASVLVNELSTVARTRLIETAEKEVERTELRLVKNRRALATFRNRKQSLDPTLEATSNLELIQGMQKDLLDLRARRAVLRSTVSAASPSVRVLDRQIASVAGQIAKQRLGTGTGTGSFDSGNLASALSKYSDLTLEEGFASKSYGSALTSLETAQAEARKEERYFAIIVEPTLPSIAEYPLAFLNTLLAAFCLFMVWLLVYLVVQSIRDHAV